MSNKDNKTHAEATPEVETPPTEEHETPEAESTVDNAKMNHENVDNDTVDNDKMNNQKTASADVSVEELQERIDTLEQEAKSNLDGWQRSRAEFTNFKRRTERETREARERASLDTIAKILPIMDDFELALGNIPEDLQDHPWINGTALILRKFEKVLDEYEVTPVDPVGEPFDPNIHEAVGTDDTDEVESGHVTVTLRKGYMSGDRVLRPALVRVAN